jgi:hypothetical protein
MEACCFHHQTIIVAIDLYAEKGSGSSGVLFEPHGIGGGKRDNIP